MSDVGPFWTILDNFLPFFHNCTGPQINEQNLKHDLNVHINGPRKTPGKVICNVISICNSTLVLDYSHETPCRIRERQNRPAPKKLIRPSAFFQVFACRFQNCFRNCSRTVKNQDTNFVSHVPFLESKNFTFRSYVT